MAKRILSLVLSVALLLGCVSGLALISSAANTLVTGDMTPSAYDGTQGAYYNGTFQGFNVWGWQKGGWVSWNGGKLANLLGVPAEEANISVSFDYYWEDVENKDGGTWWQIKSINADMSANEPLTHWANADEDNMVKNQWAEFTFTRTAVLGAAGQDDFFINVGELNNSKLYIRGMKVVATIGDDTYTAVSGSYRMAKLDFSTGEIVGTNANITYNHPNEDDGDEGNGIYEVGGSKGIKMSRQNRGFGMHFNAFGLTEGEDVAVTFEYYMPGDVVKDNTRMNLEGFGVLRAGGANLNATPLVKDAWGTYTLILTGDQAAGFVNGRDINTHCYNHNDNAETGGDYYFIKSVSVMPASLLAAAPADPGYKFYDYEETYAPNPFYPGTTVPKAYGMSVAHGDYNNELGRNTIAYYNVTSDASAIGIKFIMKEDATATSLSIDYQNVAEAEGWKGNNGQVAEVIDGVATYTFADAVFQNGLNGLGSFRMGLDAAEQVARVEVYELQDMAELDAAIVEASSVDTTGKTEASIAKLTAAIAAAQAVSANEWSTAADIAAAITAMVDAAAALKDIPEVGYGSALGHTAFDHFEGTYQDEGANIGFTDQGEWFEYEVNVTEAGLYNINIDMATGNADSTVEVQNGDGKVYGSFVVPQADWGTYNTYTVTTALAAGVQKIRILYKQSSANYRGLTLSDARYTLTNANWSLGMNGINPGEIVLYNGSYAYKTVGGGKLFGFADANGVLDDATEVVYEYEIAFETENGNSRWFIWFGGENNSEEHGFAAHGGWNPVPEKGEWGTISLTNSAYDPTANYAGANGLIASFMETSDEYPDAPSALYIRSAKMYDKNNPEKFVLVEFAELGDKTELQAAVDAEITDLSGYTSGSAQAYTDALNNAKAVLADEMALQEAIDAALAALNAAADALAEITDYSSMSFEGGVMNNVNSNITHNHPDEDDAEGNGIFEVAPESGIYGIKLSKQNRGFGYAVQNSADWLAEGDQVQLVVKYYAPSDAAQDNSRIGFQFDGDVWYRVRTGATDDANFVVSGLIKDEVGSFTILLSAAESQKVLENKGFNIYFWNYNDNAETGGDYLYLTEVRLEKAPDKTALQAAVDNAIEDLSDYTEASAKAYTDALAAAQAVLDRMATQDEIDAALAALNAAADALAIGYAQITFENDTVNTVNGNILHNHPDEDDADADNGIYEIVAESGIYGIKVSKQNRGFGFGINNDSGWLTTDTDIKLTVTYYAPSEVVQDNTRMPFQISGNEWHTARVGEAAVDVSPLAKDEVASFTYTLTAEEAAAIVANGNVFVHFWNYNDNPDTGADYIYVTAVRIENAKAADKTDLQAAVDAAIEDLSGYTADSAAAYTEALEAAKAVLENEEATAEDIKAALKALNEAAAALEELTHDVIVVDISTTEGDRPKVGNTVFFTFTVKNNGETTIPAGALYGGIVKIGDTMIGWSDNYKNVDVAPALAPGETLVLTLCGGGANGDGSWVVTAEAVEVFAQVNDNPSQGINESNLDNNTYTETITPTTLDLAAINAAIADVEALENLDEYTEESVAALNEALAAAKAAVAKADATQDEIDAAKAALDAAKAALEKKPTPPVEGLLGDVNGDEKVNTTDARVILQYAAEIIDETGLDLSVADVDGDGKVNTTDARVILQLAAEIIDKLPAAK